MRPGRSLGGVGGGEEQQRAVGVERGRGFVVGRGFLRGRPCGMEWAARSLCPPCIRPLADTEGGRRAGDLLGLWEEAVAICCLEPSGAHPGELPTAHGPSPTAVS